MSPKDLFSVCFCFLEEFDPLCFPRHKYVMRKYAVNNPKFERNIEFFPESSHNINIQSKEVYSLSLIQLQSWIVRDIVKTR